MRAPRVYFASAWGTIALFTLYTAIVGRSAVAWWILLALVPPLVVFVWWMRDRAVLERRIKRLEARSEIGDERRVVANADLTKVEDMLGDIETRVAQIEGNESSATRTEVSGQIPVSGQHISSVAGFISVNPK